MTGVWSSVVVMALFIGCSSAVSDCYNTKCWGDKDFNTTAIDCDQSTNVCGRNETGYPSCDLAPSGGDGTNCTHTSPLDFYCSSNATTGAAVCEYTPEHSCYSQRCYGTGENATFITCDGATSRCSVDDTGAPVCSDDARGSGVDCDASKAFYCDYSDATLTKPTCVYPEAHDCFNTKCGDPSQPDTLIDCPQSEGHCAVNTTDGSIFCDKSNSTLTGAGIDCPHTSPLDFYCGSNATTGDAVCNYTPEHSCYSLRCYGTGENATFIACDGASSRCSVDDTGAPVCSDGARGSGVDCNTTKTFYCGYEEPSLTKPTCKYSEPYSCFNTKCGDLSQPDSLIDCPQSKGHCGVNVTTGAPICVSSNSTTGDGVFCQGKYTCNDNSKTGVASCHTKSSLLPLWVVLGAVGLIVLVVIIIVVVKNRNKAADQTPLL